MSNISKIIYEKSYKYLEDNSPDEIDSCELEKYFVANNNDFSSLEDIFVRFVTSTQNYQGMPNSIKLDERKDEIKVILHNYDLKWIANQSVEDLFKEFCEKFDVKVVNKNKKYNSWYKWSHSIIDIAKFVSTFKDVDEFKSFVEQFNFNLTMRIALPLLISTKINGMGFALACDALKEMGYINYVKPDVHIQDVCYELGLCDSRNQIEVFETMIKLADECKITPYKLDKIFWLICSGRYTLHGKKVRGLKKEFIDMLKQELKIHKQSMN